MNKQGFDKVLFPQMNVWYQGFVDHVNRIAQKIIDDFDEYPLCYSGGIDCTMILASLLLNGVDPKKIRCYHVDLSSRNSFYGCHTRIARYITDMYGVLFQVLPPAPSGRIIESTVMNMNGFSHVLHGDGLDRMYCHSYKKDNETGIHFTHGERFRTRYPWVDYVSATLPSMAQGWRKPVVRVDQDHVSQRFDQFEKDNDCRLIRYVKDKDFATFMYGVANTPGLWSLLFWKPFNKWYIEDVWGVSHHQLCKGALV